MKQRFRFINPAGSHNVFMGWQYFLNKYYDFHLYTHGNPAEKFGTFHELNPSRIILLFRNFIALYDKAKFEIAKDDIVLVGDIFTNTLCYILKNGIICYYSEFFEYRKNWIKKTFFYLLGLLFFRNKRFIVPTLLAKETFEKISNRVFYLPQIYHGEISKWNPSRNQEIHLLFVGRISQRFKNTDFLVDNYLELKMTYPNLHLKMVGQVFDADFYTKYASAIESKEIEMLWQKNLLELDAIYRESDIFVLPSNSDPIWAVVQEAMAHGCAVMVSDTVGASCYVENGVNGYVFETDNASDFQQKIKRLFDNPWLLSKFRDESCTIIQDKFWYGNQKLLDQFHNNLTNFIHG